MPYGWPALLMRGMSGGLDALVKGVDRRARVKHNAAGGRTWDIIIDDVDADIEEPLSVQIAKGTVLYQTHLQDHIQLLQV